MKVKIPKHRTPQQAEVVADYIGGLAFAICSQYQVKILDHQLKQLKRKQPNLYQPLADHGYF